MKIFNFRIDRYTKTQFQTALGGYLKGEKAIKISKINTEFLQRGLRDKKFLKVVNSADLNIVDGRGVLWAARYLTLPLGNHLFRGLECVWQMIYSGVAIMFNPKFITYPIPEALPGVEAFKIVMQIASDNKEGVFLFGASEKNLKLAVDNIKREFPKLKISGFVNGYDYNKDKTINVVAEINKTDAKVLMVALGSPRQEYWIDENIDKLKNIRVAVGEGGTLDRIANPSQKSPKFINRIGLEWLWRLFFNKSKTETRNRFQRFWNAVPSFIYQTVKWKIRNGQTEI